ncbi:MAG: hypothetical protein WCK77_05010 [Verrucomicrobiota bacterium]
MQRSSLSILWHSLTAAAGIVLLAGSARAQTAPQSVTLNAGWNAVWLEVEPTDANGNRLAPQAVFNNPSIQVIATPQPLAGTAEYFGSDPTQAGTFNQDGWQQWKSSDPAGTNNLPLIFGNRPYLIQVATGASPIVLTLSGRTRFFRPTWTPDRFNLVGFGLNGTPSFDAFFGPSGTTHPVARIFRLNSATGNWEHVIGSNTLVADQAYWIYCAGPSSYMGPVAVDFTAAVSGSLNFAGPGDTVPVGTGVDAIQLDLSAITFTNLSNAPAAPLFNLVTPDPHPGTLVLYAVKPTSSDLAYARGDQIGASPASSPVSPAIGALSTGTLTIGATRNWSSGQAGRTNTYRLATGVGASFWLPVSASLNDLHYPTDPTPVTPAASMKGLWVGEIVIDSSTSIVEDGAPLRPSAAKTPARILLHFDGTKTRLLSQVTIMQTKTADPAVPPVPVLVVDAARIPFFEGIKERNGKRVGMRLEAVTYDMPRLMDATSQAALLADPAYPGLTADGLAAFLVSRSIRPPSLAETYRLSLDLAGAPGAGQTLTTYPGTLVLDPFHRSNPFRHAYHHDHSNGPAITREMEIHFDPSQSIGDHLSGGYKETIKGLIQSNLVLTGRVEFQRISPVDALQGAQ